MKPPSLRGDPEITYSRSTYVAIRSGKHDTSTTYTHGRDFDRLLEQVVKHKNAVKSISMFFCDGGPDENPRFPKYLTLPYSILRNTIWMSY